jgi:hypothetical protein
MKVKFVRAVAASTLAAALAASVSGSSSHAEGSAPMKLFKIITAKDEIVVGLSEEELRGFGPKADLDNLANQIAFAGQLTVWQYAVKKGDDGSLRQAPAKRVAVFKTDTLRIEPYATPLPVDSPKSE